jgi:hypothetical protein
MIHPDENVLDWNISVPRDATEITVEHTWVTLEYQVDLPFPERAPAR